MNIELVEFYTLTRDDKNRILTGTLHIYFPEWDLDIRGIFLTKLKSHFFIKVPHRIAIDDDTKEEVRYPVFSFTQKDKQKAFVKRVLELAKPYVMEKILNQPGYRELIKRQKKPKKPVQEKPREEKKSFPMKDYIPKSGPYRTSDEGSKNGSCKAYFPKENSKIVSRN